MALNLSDLKKKNQPAAEDSAVIVSDTEDTPVVSDGNIERVDYFADDSQETSPVSLPTKSECAGVVHAAFGSAVPLPWVAKNDEHALFNLTLEEKYLDAKIFVGAITIRSSFVDRKETMMLL